MSGATVYTYGASHNLGGNCAPFTSAAVGNAGGYTVLNCGSGVNMIGGQFRINSTDGAGTSTSSTVGATCNMSLSTCA